MCCAQSGAAHLIPLSLSLFLQDCSSPYKGNRQQTCGCGCHWQTQAGPDCCLCKGRKINTFHGNKQSLTANQPSSCRTKASLILTLIQSVKTANRQLIIQFDGQDQKCNLHVQLSEPSVSRVKNQPAFRRKSSFSIFGNTVLKRTFSELIYLKYVGIFTMSLLICLWP